MIIKIVKSGKNYEIIKEDDGKDVVQIKAVDLVFILLNGILNI